MPRPSKGDDARRNILTLRVTNDVKDQLTQAADESDRSLSQEILSRLERSLQRDQDLGGRATVVLTKFIASAIQLIEAETETDWTKDQDTFLAVRAAVITFLDRKDPGAPQEEQGEIDRLRDEAAQAHAAYEAARAKRNAFRISELGWMLPEESDLAPRRGMFGKSLPAIAHSLDEPIRPFRGILGTEPEVSPELQAKDDELDRAVREALDAWGAANERVNEATARQAARRQLAQAGGRRAAYNILGIPSTPHMERLPTFSPTDLTDFLLARKQRG